MTPKRTLRIVLFACIYGMVVSSAHAQTYGAASILPECLDPHPKLGVGPSARARECTRLYCSRGEYLIMVESYARRKPQTNEQQLIALTCITRKEQDIKSK